MSAILENNERIVGGYRLGKRLGLGAQGHVYRATSVNGKGEVALKLYEMPFESQEEQKIRKRVEREFRALNSLHNPYVVRAIENGEHREPRAVSAGYFWTAFELVEGRDLRHMLQNQSPGMETCLAMLRALSEGLTAVHGASLLHRDIKPDNVILRRRKWDEPVLVDFGFVRNVNSSNLTKTGFAVGTAGYIAPEVLRDPRSSTSSSDNWSFARLAAEVVLWEKGEDLDDIRRCSFDEGEVSEFCESWGNVAAVLEQGVESEPENRFDDATSFVNALEEALYADGVLEEESDEEEFEGVKWDRRRPLKSYLELLGFRVSDNRWKGGALWVIATQEQFEKVADYLSSRGVHFTYKAQGGRASEGQPAWYTSANR